MIVSIRVTLKSGGYIDTPYLRITYQSIPTTDNKIRVSNCYCINNNISYSPHLVYIIMVVVIVLILD